jgi:Helix-turn-helix domain
MILMDLGEAAAELHCSERWLANNLRAGRFPAKKIGRKWVLDDDDIAAILQICSVTPDGFSTDSPVSFAPRSSMTKTTLRRIQQSRHPREETVPDTATGHLPSDLQHADLGEDHASHWRGTELPPLHRTATP